MGYFLDFCLSWLKKSSNNYYLTNSKKDEDIMELKLKETDLKMQIENLKSQLSQQVNRI